MRTAARVAAACRSGLATPLASCTTTATPDCCVNADLFGSLAAAWLDTPVAVAGVEHEQAADLCVGTPPPLPTSGREFWSVRLGGHGRCGSTGPLVGVEQASLSAVTVAAGLAGAPTGTGPRGQSPRPVRARRRIPISLAAYERAFEAKVRWDAGKHADTDELDFPPRYRVDDDGALRTDYTLVPLPRTAVVYTEVTVHVPVPGLKTPYSLVIVELDEVGVRALVKVTSAEPGSVASATAAAWCCAGWRCAPGCRTTATHSNRKPF